MQPSKVSNAQSEDALQGEVLTCSLCWSSMMASSPGGLYTFVLHVLAHVCEAPIPIQSTPLYEQHTIATSHGTAIH